VGNAEEARGLLVHGPVSSGAVVAGAGGVAQAFAEVGDVEVGDVVRLDGGRILRTERAADPGVAGVVTSTPGLLLGGPLAAGALAVAVCGVAMAKAEAESGAIESGDVLVSSAVPGHARAAAGMDLPAHAVLGRALDPLASGRGVLRVLLRLS
jgi:hypothetical protein